MFPKEKLEKPESSEDSHIFPVYDQFSRYPPLDLSGERRFPESQIFHLNSHKEWNVDNLSSGKIRKMIDQMLKKYKLMCTKGKIEVEACKALIQCFTGTL